MPSITFWTRLEPRAREATMARSLQAQMRDPLWMLARQWQVGEFRGEDAGSPIQATYRAESLNLTSYQPDGGKIVELDTGLPLEAHVEREAVVLGLRGAVQLGQRFEALLREARLADLIPQFRNVYAIASTPPAGELPDAASQEFRLVVASRVTDGNALYRAAKALLAGQQPVPAPPMPTDKNKEQKVRTILQDFVNFRESLYSEPAHDSAWIQERLEYQFAVGAQSSEQDFALGAPEFQGGHLDWYSFAVLSNPVDAGNPTGVQIQDRAIMPNHVTFRGMPNNRWWNFEDNSVDIGQLDTEQVDLAKMLVMEYALAYGNDWFELPIQLPVGSLSKVTLLVVTDTFGERTLIKPTLEQTPPLQQPWSMFTLSGDGKRSNHLFIPPMLDMDATMEGPVLEDVLFLRDEMAAMGWAVQQTLQGPLDVPVDGSESYLKQLVDNPPPGPPTATPGGPSIYYLLGIPAPYFWIPLIPIVTPQKALYLRRGYMDLPAIGKIAARALILDPDHPFFVTDQTVSRAGVEVTRSFRRIRWNDGSTFVWMARKTRPGRGPGWSGLAFDLLKPLQQEK